MNCKPGERAIRVKQFENSHIPCGTVVICIRFIGYAFLYGKSGPDIKRDDVWDVDYRGAEYGIPDDHLLPLRDPGEDAKDETLSWLPVPSTEKESA